MCPHQEEWEDRVYDPRDILQVMHRLQKCGARLFWNTGRRHESLAGVAREYLDFSGYFIHGSCYWNAEKKLPEWVGPMLPEALRQRAEQDVATASSTYKLEIKKTSLRLTPAPGESVKDIQPLLQTYRTLTPPEWDWIEGPRGAELLARGFDKAFAVKRECPQESNARVCIAVGDDRLDVPAFLEVWKRGGWVGVVHNGALYEQLKKEHPRARMAYFQSSAELLQTMSVLSVVIQ